MKVVLSWLTSLFTKKAIDKNSGESIKISRPILKPFDKDRFELVSEYAYKGVIVPVGYKTNGANIPRLFWSLFPPNSPEYLSAVIMHDWLCDEAEKIYKLGFKSKAKERFKFADIVLKEMMTALGCNRFKVVCFYYACRAWHKLMY